MRFVKRNQTSNKCTDALADRYCSNPTIEVDEWPPSLTSTAKTSFRENNNTYSYDMDFTFFYMYVNCPKLEDDPIHEEDSNATSKIIFSRLFICQRNFMMSSALKGHDHVMS